MLTSRTKTYQPIEPESCGKPKNITLVPVDWILQFKKYTGFGFEVVWEVTY